MTSTGEGLRTVAQAVHDALGGDEPRVTHITDALTDDWVDVLNAPDRPGPGSMAFGTIGMSRHDLGLSVGGTSVRLELAGSMTALVPEFGQALATAALQVVSGEYEMQPGAVFPDVLGGLRDDVFVPHLLFVPVFLWELPNLEVDGVLVTWLQAVPITQTEYEFAREHGSSDALQSLLEAHGVDVEHAWRDSVV